MADEQQHGFKDLLNKMMARRWYISAMVLGGFMVIIIGIFVAIMDKSPMSTEWKELLLLLLGALIGSYGKIIDYWFSDTDKDKMLVQKMDEEDGQSLSNTNDMKESNHNYAPLIPDAFANAAVKAQEMQVVENVQEFELAKKEQEHKHEMELLNFHHEHRQCEHDWVDDGNGEFECSKCGKIKDPDHHDVTEG